MTFDKFAKKWLGKRVDYDEVYSYQCVDLIKQYTDEVYGLKAGSWGNAIDYWTNTAGALKKKFDRKATKKVKKGDIVPLTGSFYFYSNGRKIYPGHIGIATGKQTTTAAEILEQNGATGGGTGKGGDAIRKRYIAKSRIPGILRPKEVNLKYKGKVYKKTFNLNAKGWFGKARYWFAKWKVTDRNLGKVQAKLKALNKSFDSFKKSSVAGDKKDQAKIDELQSTITNLNKEVDIAKRTHTVEVGDDTRWFITKLIDSIFSKLKIGG